MPLLESWVASANSPETDFPLNNLPYGSFLAADDTQRCGVAIGDRILDVSGLWETGLLEMFGADDVFAFGDWTEFMALGAESWSALRARLTDLLRAGSGAGTDLAPHLLPQTGTRMALPFTLAEYTDFYAGKHHATNVGTMFRGPENALPPNWLSMPIGYNGRASSVVVSGTPVRRPWGQVKGPDAELPHLAPTARFDFELELGAIVGQPSEAPVTVAEADAMIFGYVLLNDWSARDIQAWEYQPLGPFQSKATATTISPWIVPGAALEPFRCPCPPRDRPLLPHLREPGPLLYDIALEVGLAPEGAAETIVARTNTRELYYAPAQQLAHHTTCGCPMNVGDLLGSGTISGPDPSSRGSLLELAWGGQQPITLHTGATRSFLEDGDTCTLYGHARGDGYRIGFGACSGQILPARDSPYRS